MPSSRAVKTSPGLSDIIGHPTVYVQLYRSPSRGCRPEHHFAASTRGSPCGSLPTLSLYQQLVANHWRCTPFSSSSGKSLQKFAAQLNMSLNIAHGRQGLAYVAAVVAVAPSEVYIGHH